jgi:hypothetical protein
MRYLFGRRFNLTDGIALSACTALMQDGHYLVGIGVWTVGLMISCLGELAAGVKP